MPSPTWLQMGLTAEKALSKGEGCSFASRRRLKEQVSEGQAASASNFLRTPLAACCSIGESGKIWPLTLQSELWLSYKILWSQFLSQIWVIPVSLHRYIFPQTCSFWHFQSHLWLGIGPSWPRILDIKITFEELIIIAALCASIESLLVKLKVDPEKELRWWSTCKNKHQKTNSTSLSISLSSLYI